MRLRCFVSINIGGILLKCAHGQKVPFCFFPELFSTVELSAQHDDGIDLAVRYPSGLFYAFNFRTEMPA